MSRDLGRGLIGIMIMTRTRVGPARTKPIRGGNPRGLSTDRRPVVRGQITALRPEVRGLITVLVSTHWRIFPI